MPVDVPYGPERGGRFSSIRTVDRNAAIAEYYGNTGFNLVAMLKKALAAGTLESVQIAREFAEALTQTVRASKNQLANLHHEVGKLAQDEVVTAYSRIRAERGGPASYRDQETHKGRDANSRLLHALGDAEFFRGTYDGIGFANKVHLDRQARQWYRLNFGARPAPGAARNIGPGNRSTPAPVTWKGLQLGTLKLPTGPSKAFYLPLGTWNEAGQFHHPIGPAFIATGGVAAWNFLDAGIATIAAELPGAYSKLHGDWARSATRGVGPLSRVVSVRATMG